MDAPQMILAATLALSFALGFCLGLLHFASLRRFSERLLSGGPVRLAVALHLARLALIVALLVGLATQGAGPLLAGALGLVAAREAILRRARKEA
jgi:F1F0 ATPase subunit 2